MTFAALGLVAVGCGGNTSSNASTSDPAVEAPTNPDQPSANTDQASNPDQAPANLDQPPGSPDAPAGTGGGRLGELCNQLCSSLDKLANRCGNGMGDLGMNSICSDSAKCQIPANFPCQNEIADAFDCVLHNIDLLCSNVNQDPPNPGGDQNTAAPVQPCQDVSQTYLACLQASGVTDTGNQPPDNNPNANCNTRGGCDCSTDCLTCQCDAGADQTAQQACVADVCAAP